MKDIEQALTEKPDRAKTYVAKDPYGDDIECFECCPGVTVKQMLALHEGKPLEYMKGPLMPYTAIVDPHTLQDLGGIQRGEATTAEAFIAVISRHAKVLEEQRGKGTDSKLWEYVLDAQTRVDLLLGEEKLEKALALVAEMEKKTARQNDTVTRKVEAARETVLSDAAARLDALEKRMGGAPAFAGRASAGGPGADVRAEARLLAKLLKGTNLADRASAIEAKTKS